MCYHKYYSRVFERGCIKLNNEFQSQIVSLIPSNSLKTRIKLSNVQFSDADLLTIAFCYAPDFDTRIDFLRRLKDCSSGELKEYISRLIHVQFQMLESFLKHEEDVVFELHIKETPDAYDERHLCRSFEDAVNVIPLFYKEYDCKENTSSRYTVIKRRVFSKETDFSEDVLGEIDLLPGMKTYSVAVYSFEHWAEGCCGECWECDRPCADCHEILFPAFVKHGDAVKYYSYSGKESFGIAIEHSDLPCSDYYVIPLDSNAVRYHDFANIFDAHEHIPAPLTEKIEIEELPVKMRENYKACLKYIMDKWPPRK